MVISFLGFCSSPEAILLAGFGGDFKGYSGLNKGLFSYDVLMTLFNDYQHLFLTMSFCCYLFRFHVVLVNDRYDLTTNNFQLN